MKSIGSSHSDRSISMVHIQDQMNHESFCLFGGPPTRSAVADGRGQSGFLACIVNLPRFCGESSFLRPAASPFELVLAKPLSWAQLGDPDSPLFQVFFYDPDSLVVGRDNARSALATSSHN